MKISQVNVAGRSTGFPFNRSQFSWALFQFAISPYAYLILIFVFAPYFSQQVIGDSTQGQAIWSYAGAASGLCIIVLAPTLGAIADKSGGRKKWIAAFMAPMALAASLLWFAVPGLSSGMVLAIALAIVCVNVSGELIQVFHNAMLPDLVDDNKVGSLSGLGMALGNAASFTSLLLFLYFIILPSSEIAGSPFLPSSPAFGLDPDLFEPSRFAGPASALWLLLFAAPFFLFVKDKPSSAVTFATAAREGLLGLVATIRNVKGHRNVATFLVARMLYNDGVIATIGLGGIFAAGVLGYSATENLILALFVAASGILGSLLAGWVIDRLGAIRAIYISVTVLILGLIGTVSLNSSMVFFIPFDATDPANQFDRPFFETWPKVLYLLVVILKGLSVPASMAASRALLAKIAPKEKMSEFFGIYSFSGMATGWLAMLTVGLFTSLFESQAIGLASALIFLFAGLAIMPFVREVRE